MNLVGAWGNCSTIVCISPRNEYVPEPSAPITLAITIMVPNTRGILIDSSQVTNGLRV